MLEVLVEQAEKNRILYSLSINVSYSFFSKFMPPFPTSVISNVEDVILYFAYLEDKNFWKALTKPQLNPASGGLDKRSIRTIPNLTKRSKHYAIDNNRSLAAIFVEALEEYLDNH